MTKVPIILTKKERDYVLLLAIFLFPLMALTAWNINSIHLLIGSGVFILFAILFFSESEKTSMPGG